MVHVKPIEAAQARPSASSPGLAADRKTAATVSLDQPPYQTDVVLRDGSTLRLRPVRRDDRDGLTALHDRLSATAAVLIDDAARPGEQQMLAQWQSAYPDVPFTFHWTQNGAGLGLRSSEA